MGSAVVALSLVLTAGPAASSSASLRASASVRGVAPAADVLFAVQARGGRLIPKGDGEYSLTLLDLPREVVGFSDRPQRDTFNMPTSRFFRGFWRNVNRTPPAAALDIRDSDNRRDAVVLRIWNPRLRHGRLELEATLLPVGSSDLDHYAGSRIDRTPPRRFGSASLFLDTGPKPGAKRQAAPTKDARADLLFVTGARSGRLDRRKRGRYELTLHGVRDQVVAFSEHPVDLTYNVSSPTFFGRWWNHLFSDASPNGALDFLTRSSDGDSIALELSKPRLKGADLRLDARPLGDPAGGLTQYRGRTLDALPRRFGNLSLFIDPAIGNPPNSSNCIFDIRGRTSALAYDRYEAEGSSFNWRQPSGYGVPFDGVPAATLNGTQVTREGNVKWDGEATQPLFSSLNRCSAQVSLNLVGGPPAYTLKVTDYILAADRGLASPIECNSLLRYWSCEKSVKGAYYRNCWYPTDGATEDAYCVEEWDTTANLVLCDEAPAFPPRHTCPSWVPPHDPTDSEPLGQFRR